MPLYDYTCARCGPFREFRAVSERNETVRCPQCGTGTSRVLTAPLLNLMSNVKRVAETRNEKSAHEPAVVSRAATSPSGPPAPTRTRGSQRSHRPWMLGH